jgi:putative AdoMet-dependent methyltransferase
LKKSNINSEVYLQAGNHDDIADTYENSVISGYYNGDFIREKYFELLDAVVSFLDLSPGLRILDVGIGTGFLAEKLPIGNQVYGIDISTKMMDVLKKKNLNVILKYGSFLDIPYKENFFDRIVSTYAFHHIPYEYQQSAFNEMNRTLKPNGSLVIGDLMFKNKSSKNELRSYLKHLGKNYNTADIDEEYFAFIKDSSAYLKKVGFKTEYKQISTLSWILKGVKA